VAGTTPEQAALFATPEVAGVLNDDARRRPSAPVVLRSTPFEERVDREVAKEAAFREVLRSEQLGKQTRGKKKKEEEGRRKGEGAGAAATLSRQQRETRARA